MENISIEKKTTTIEQREKSHVVALVIKREKCTLNKFPSFSPSGAFLKGIHVYILWTN